MSSRKLGVLSVTSVCKRQIDAADEQFIKCLICQGGLHHDVVKLTASREYFDSTNSLKVLIFVKAIPSTYNILTTCLRTAQFQIFEITTLIVIIPLLLGC